MRVALSSTIFDSLAGETAPSYFDYEIDQFEEEAVHPMMHVADDEKFNAYYPTAEDDAAVIATTTTSSNNASNPGANAMAHAGSPYIPQPPTHHLYQAYQHEQPTYFMNPLQQPYFVDHHHPAAELPQPYLYHLQSRQQVKHEEQVPPPPHQQFMTRTASYGPRGALSRHGAPGAEAVDDEFAHIWNSATPIHRPEMVFANAAGYAPPPATDHSLVPRAHADPHVFKARMHMLQQQQQPERLGMTKAGSESEFGGLYFDEVLDEVPNAAAPRQGMVAAAPRAQAAASANASSMQKYPIKPKKATKTNKKKRDDPEWQLPELSVKRTKVAKTDDAAAAAARKPAAASLQRKFSNDSGSSGASHESSQSAMSGELNKKIYYRRSWTPEEDERLLQLVKEHGAMRWSRIAEHMPGKSGNQCSQRWHKALDPTIVKGKWSEAEDKLLVSLVKEKGKKWKEISFSIPGRTGKQCRDRYTARLNPNLRTGKWSPEEEQIALEAHKRLGNRWAAIQKLLPHRSWYTIKWKIESFSKQTTPSD